MYASITPELLEKSITFAAMYTDISLEAKETIRQASNSFLQSDNTPWIKKSGGTFDITMGGYHGAEVCDLVGLYLLSELIKILPKEGTRNGAHEQVLKRLISTRLIKQRELIKIHF